MRSSCCSGGRAAAASSVAEIRFARRSGLAQPLPRALQRLLETVLAERLQQIIHRVRVERPHRVLIVGRHENHRDRWVDQFQHLEAIQLRHLHVQEHQVRLVLRDRLHRLESVGAFGDRLPRRPPGSRYSRSRCRASSSSSTITARIGAAAASSRPDGVALQIPQIHQQLARRLIAPLAILLQALAHDALELFRHFVVEARHRIRRRLQNPRHRFLRRSRRRTAACRWPSGTAPRPG